MNFFQNIKLENYRNFKFFEIDFREGCNVLIGKNGAGKTNILESISLFEKGRGIRKESIKNLINNKSKYKNFMIRSIFVNNSKKIDISITNEIKELNFKKKLLVNNSDKKDSLLHFSNLFSFIYFLPEMERLFLNSPSIRRNFIDRLIFSTDKNYNKILNSYKKILLERYKALSAYNNDYEWIKVIEQKIADLGTEIYKRRIEIISLLNNNLINSTNYQNKLYKVKFHFIDPLLNNKVSINDDFVQIYLDKLKDSGKEDAITGGCKYGPHKSDLVGYNIDNKVNINQYSTGQQKTILLLIILTHCNYLVNNINISPILLFDEVCSHLDSENRKILLNIIESLNSQIFMTGNDESFFSFLSTKASYCNIT